MENKLLPTIRRRLLLFIVLLVLSGLTAIPVAAQLHAALFFLSPDMALYRWLLGVLNAYELTSSAYPFLLYGYDWLAFAHVVIAIFFIGPYKNPLQNGWVITAGLWACALVLPVAFVAGALRGIPLWWRLVDCSFGVFGFLLLQHIQRLINRFAVYESISKPNSPCITSNT